MFIYRNALKNLLRNRGRNILVSIILLIVMTAMTVSLVIHSTSEKMIDDFQDSFGVESEIIFDWGSAGARMSADETAHEDDSAPTVHRFEVPESIPIEQLVSFADSDYVQSALFSASVQYTSDDLEPVPPTDEDVITLAGLTIEELKEMHGVDTREELLERFFTEEQLERIANTRRDVVGVVSGYSDVSMMQEFREGQRVIVDGRMIEDFGEVIIGDRLAELNDIHVGDTITITGPRYIDTGIIPLTVVGIFTDHDENLNTADQWHGTRASDIIVSFDTLYSSGFSDIFPRLHDIRYFLRDPDAVEPFMADLRAMGLVDAWTLYSDIEAYNRIVEPVQRMSSVAATFGIVILLTGAVVLIFLSIMNIRERKYEVGVLRAIGMKKHRLARGMVYESLSLVTLCTAIGLPLGLVLSEPVSRVLLEASEITHTGVTLAPATLPLLLLIAVGLAVISSLIGILYITQYEPIKILQERN